MVSNMEKYRLHTGWTFCLDERNEKEETAPSEGFRAVTLPHDWSTDYPFDPESDTCGSGGYAKAGIGWYQRTITISENDIKSRQIILYFEGVYMKSSVFVNGTYAGGHIYGYTPFEVDITALVHEGENEILVRVDNSMQPGSRWYSGSGITRDVWLEKRHPIHIARYGMYLTTDEGNLNISTTLHTSECMKNDDSLSLNFVLKDNDGAEIAKKNIELENDWMEADLDAAILSGMDEDVPKTLCQLQTSLSIQVENPVLWDHETPYLYELTTILKKNDTVIDERTDKVGFRNIKFDAKKGFLINGKHVKLNGVCLHHDGGCVGAAVPPEIWRRRLEKLKDMGVNSVRCSHNPPDEALLDLCDELGLLMMDEAFDEWENPKNKWSTGHNVYPPKHEGYAEDFPEWHERDLADMVRRDRNHPSIVMWSIGNEIDYPNDPYCHPLFETMTGNNDANKPAKERQYDPNKPNAEQLSVIAKELAAIVRTQDTTRPVTLAAAFPELSSHIGFFDALDVVGYNYKEHLYEESHKRFPDKPFLGSENGGGYEQWCAVRDNAYISGQFLWTGIDYLGEAHGWPIHGSSAGLMDLAGFEKPGFYRRKAFWSTEPFACILTRPDDGDEHEWRPWNAHWNYTDGENVVVRVFTNVQKETISLSIVGLDGEKSLHDGTYLEKEGCTEWRFAYEPGVLKAVCGKAECSIQTAGKAVELSANVWHAEETINKEEVMQIEVSLTDENGVLAAEDLEITAEVIGGTLLGLENGDLADLTPYCESHRKTHNGRLIVYVKPKEDVKVCISCPALDKRVWIE